MQSVDSPELDELMLALGRPQYDHLLLTRRQNEQRLVHGTLGALRFMSLQTSGESRFRSVSPADAVTIHFDVGSDAGGRHNGELVGRHDLVIFIGAAEYERRTQQTHRGMSFRIPLALATAALSVRAPGAALLESIGATRIAADRPITVTRLQQFSRPILALSKPTDAFPLSPAAVSARLADLLLDSLLVPGRDRGTAAVRPPYHQRLPVLRRAEDFMRAHLGHPLMLHEICLAARASERTVEYAFQEVYGVGAKQYLRLLRLAAVHRELLRPSPSSVIIRDLAAQCGFWHMGHFGTAYRAIYGESPRDTMRGRPRFARR